MSVASAPAAEGEVLIRVEHVSKRFCRSLKRSMWYGLQDIFADVTGSSARHDLRPHEFWALDDISFEVRRGECLGLIGHNGAGKTTLLRMLNGLIKPDRGRVEMRGRVGALIALGAGFNPILTGRENIYVNASVLGLSKAETDAKMDEIIDFAELRESIDTPVQNYSSGMSVRLGFAVAAILLKPDILFLDEVLAVGDISFTIKCLNIVRQLSRDSAVVFVSHNMQFVSAFCTRVMVLSHGRCELDTPSVGEGVDHYFAMVPVEQNTSGAGGATIHEAVIEGRDATGEARVEQGAPLRLSVRLSVRGAASSGATVRVFVEDEGMSPVVCLPVESNPGRPWLVQNGEWSVELDLGRCELNAGKYSVMIAVSDAESSVVMVRAQGLTPFRVASEQTHWGKIVRPAVVTTVKALSAA